MDKIRPSSNITCLRWECPQCKYIVGFLPTNLELPCPRCEKVRAKDFTSLGYGPLNQEEVSNG